MVRMLNCRIFLGLALALDVGEGIGTDSFTPGAVCDGVDANGLANQLLRGKHLRVLELEWFPFAVKDTTSPYGWTGFDIDLLTRVSIMLNFTFEVHESGVRAEDETWTDVLVRTVNDGDMWASWWNQAPDRIQRMSMIIPHIDTSPILARPLHVGGGKKIDFATATSFFTPFSLNLWAAIIGLVLVSGLVDYLLEREHGGTITASVYEYCGGVLWGGFQDPHTKLSAVYQVGSSPAHIDIWPAPCQHHELPLRRAAAAACCRLPCTYFACALCAPGGGRICRPRHHLSIHRQPRLCHDYLKPAWL